MLSFFESTLFVYKIDKNSQKIRRKVDQSTLLRYLYQIFDFLNWYVVRFHLKSLIMRENFVQNKAITVILAEKFRL